MALAVPPGGNSLPTTELRPRTRHAGPRTVPSSVSVVIVNYCQWKNTSKLVQQLRRSVAVRDGRADVVVVDNASPPHRLATKTARLSSVDVTKSDSNLGFAKAVNRGAKLSAGDWVLLLNPDVTVPDGFLDDVLAAAEKAAPEAGVIGFQLRNRDGSPQASVGPYPTLKNTLLGLFIPRARRKCRHQPPDGLREVPWVTGGCALIRRECFEELRGLDESYFLYYEDVDFCLRARHNGWQVWYDPSVMVTHHWPLHARKVPAPLRLMTRHALLTYTHKHWAGWQSWLLNRVVRLECTARIGMSRMRGEAEAAASYAELKTVAKSISRGDANGALARIRSAAIHLAPVAAAQDGRTR